MKLFDITVMSAEGLRERKGRVALNVLGNLSGCAAVTGLISLADGMNIQVKDQLSVIGANTLFVVPHEAQEAAMSLSATQILNQDGAELFRGSIEKGLIPAIIKYDLKFLARIPALTIHIHGDRSEFFKEVRQYVTRTYSTSYGWGWWGWHHYRHRTTTWQEFAGMKKFRETFHSLTIDIDDTDFRTGEEGEDLSEKLEELAFRILENNILPSFGEC